MNDQPPSTGFRRQVTFRVGPDDWPLLEQAARAHGGIQAGILAALRTHAIHRLQPGAAAGRLPQAPEPPKPTPERTTEPAPPADPVTTGVESANPPAAAPKTKAKAATAVIELNVADAAAILGRSPAGLRESIKRGSAPGRKTEHGYLAAIDRDTIRRSPAMLSLRGAAEVLGLASDTLRGHCKSGRYPGAVHDGLRWRIPARDLSR